MTTPSPASGEKITTDATGAAQVTSAFGEDPDIETPSVPQGTAADEPTSDGGDPDEDVIPGGGATAEPTD